MFDSVYKSSMGSKEKSEGKYSVSRRAEKKKKGILSKKASKTAIMSPNNAKWLAEKK